MAKPAAKVWRRALENREKSLMWLWLSRMNCPTWHSVDIVDPALPWGRQTQAVDVIGGSWCRKKSTASGSKFQEELSLAT